MSKSAQKYWSAVKSKFGMDADTFVKVWDIYTDDNLTASMKRKKFSEMGFAGPSLYNALGKDMD